MDSRLIYIGDKVTYTSLLNKISSIDNILYAITSTREDLSNNKALAYTRLNIRFRLSFEDNFYSDWYDLSEFDYTSEKDFSDLYVNSSASTTIDIEYILKETSEVWDEDDDYIEVVSTTVSSTPIEDTVSGIIHNIAEVSSVGNDQGLEYSEDFHYKPYDLGHAERMYDDLNFMINQVHGHEVEYVKVIMDTKKGTDFILREHNLGRGKTANVKCLKVIVPVNTFQDNSFSFNPYGVDYSEMQEIQIVDSYFKKVFGNLIPQQYDYLYFPLINRMFEVSSTFLVKGFNMVPSYWRLTLTKYEKRSNILNDEIIQDKLDGKLKGLGDEIQDIVRDESKDIINESQHNMYDDDLDFVREWINPNITYGIEEIYNYYTLISNSQYHLNSIWKENEDFSLAVTYKSKFNVKSNESTTLTFLTNLDKVRNVSYNVTFTQFSGVSYTSELIAGNYSTLFTVGKHVSFWKKLGKGKIFLGSGVITNINNDRTILTANITTQFETDDVDLISLSNIRPIICSGNNVYDQVTRIREFVKDSANVLFEVFLIDNASICIKYFGSDYYFVISESLENDIWYAMVLSFNLRFKQFAINIYEAIAQNSNPELPLVDSITIVDFDSEGHTSQSPLNLLSSPLKITNIRLFEETIDPLLHSGYLSKNIIDNEGSALIVDNALRNLELEDFSIRERRQELQNA